MKRNIKKVVTAMVTAVLTAGLMAGCGGASGGADNGTNITIFNSKMEIQSQLEEKAAEYSEEKGVGVEVYYSNDTVAAHLATRYSSNEPYTISMVDLVVSSTTLMQLKKLQAKLLIRSLSRQQMTSRLLLTSSSQAAWKPR